MRIFYLFLVTLIVGVIFSFYKYYWTSNYDLLIEVTCDPYIEKCLYRPCDKDTSKCLPNKFSYYKSYLIKAYDFSKCKDSTCKGDCYSNQSRCTVKEKIDT